MSHARPSTSLSAEQTPHNVGIVVIGRNEGDRLAACLTSLINVNAAVVYVDSGSTDGSISVARMFGIPVVELDAQNRFTAARARNEGFRHLTKLGSTLKYVQFIDGDCELAADWLDQAVLFLEKHEHVAAVCGRLREKSPDNSIYNALCDIEWDGPIGEARFCGGNAMIRADAFRSMQGFRADLIAGEEPDLCARLRASGWKIWRLESPMAVHDAAILRFSQWWNRAVRGGYALAEISNLHSRTSEQLWTREARSVWLWAFLLPTAIFVGAVGLGLWASAFFLVYPLQIVRLALRGTRSTFENWCHATFLVVGKFPELVGQFRFLRDRYLGKGSSIIEYKAQKSD